MLLTVETDRRYLCQSMMVFPLLHPDSASLMMASELDEAEANQSETDEVIE